MQVPPLFEREETRERLKRLPGGPSQPLTVHLRQEVDRLNTVLAAASGMLRNLRLAITGTIALSAPLMVCPWPVHALQAAALSAFAPFVALFSSSVCPTPLCFLTRLCCANIATTTLVY